MIAFKTDRFLFFSRTEVWFYNGEKEPESAYNVYSASKIPLNFKTQFQEKYLTSIVRLDQSEEILFSKIHPTYKYDIRSAEKREIECKIFNNPDPAFIMQICNNYKLFASIKEIAPLQEKRLNTYSKSGALIITCAYYRAELVSTHIYIRDSKTVSLLSSFFNANFNDTKVSGEGNKLLHWFDVVQFKKQGFNEYDFGGLNKVKLPGVSKFKSSFGGDEVENYRAIRSSSIINFFIQIVKQKK